MIIAAVDPWVEAPLRRFVDDARARLALLLHPSGQVVVQAGFTRQIDVMSARELGKLVDGRAFRGLHHSGKDKQLYLAPAETARGPFVCLTMFDAESSLGLVRMYFEELAKALAEAAPPLAPVREPALAANFEADLHRNLDALFARPA